MTAQNECRTCEWLFVRWKPGSRRAETLCACPTLGANPHRCHEVALHDTCEGWAERPDPFEPRGGE